jgi:hypothetical protein
MAATMSVVRTCRALEGCGTYPIGYGEVNTSDNHVDNPRYSANWIIFTVFLADNYTVSRGFSAAVFSPNQDLPYSGSSELDHLRALALIPLGSKGLFNMAFPLLGLGQL